jgi:hypothetical protein
MRPETRDMIVLGVVIASMLLGLTTLAIVMVRAQFRRADQLLTVWAERHGFVVVTKEGANPPGTGPLQRSGDKRVMLRVRVRDGAGNEKTGLFRAGSATTGTLSDDVSVEWES